MFRNLFLYRIYWGKPFASRWLIVARYTNFKLFRNLINQHKLHSLPQYVLCAYPIICFIRRPIPSVVVNFCKGVEEPGWRFIMGNGEMVYSESVTHILNGYAFSIKRQNVSLSLRLQLSCKQSSIDRWRWQYYLTVNINGIRWWCTWRHWQFWIPVQFNEKSNFNLKLH